MQEDTFHRMTSPLADPSASKQSRPLFWPSAGVERRRTRVSIVEDEGIIARDIAFMVAQAGFEVSGSVSSGQEALELMSMVVSDIVLMDIKIRGPIDGIEACEQIRRDFDVPVVFLTAHADSETIERATRAQPFGYVVKPFSEADLNVAIQLALSRHAIHRKSTEQCDEMIAALLHLRDAVFATTPDGAITFMNTAAEKLTGSNVNSKAKLLLPDVLPLWKSIEGSGVELASLFALDAPCDIAGSFIRAQDGSTQMIVGTFTPIRKSNSNIVSGFVILLRTLPSSKPTGTEHPRSQPADDQLHELSYALTNELREPVRNIGCFAQLLERKDNANLSEDSREYLRFIIEGTKRLERQMSALRRFQLASDNHEEQASPIESSELCHQVLLDLQDEISRANAEIHIGLLPRVYMAPNKFKRVVMELLQNSLRFRSERKPSIVVSAIEHGAIWRFTVEDNGVGFDRHQAERIFRMFTRGQADDEEGSGMGLAIARKLTEDNGGSICADSTPGQGSRFFFTVPAVPR
jgi:signal transduction histidine kinase